MTFVIEEIPEELKEKYGIDEINKNWIVDHEREAFSLNIRGDSEFTTSTMYWQKPIIEIIYQKRRIPRDREMPVTGWTYRMELTLHRVNVPKTLQKEEKELKKLIEEALTAQQLMVKKNVEVNITNINEQKITYI